MGSGSRSARMGRCSRDFYGRRQVCLTGQPLGTSRLADEYLWTEVLNLGGHDVLAKPFQAKELQWVLESAWRIPVHTKKHAARSTPAVGDAKAS